MTVNLSCHIVGEVQTLFFNTFCTNCSLTNAEYIMRNAGLDEAQAGIKIAGKNINNLRCVYDNTLITEGEEELKSLFMK